MAEKAVFESCIVYVQKSRVKVHSFQTAWSVFKAVWSQAFIPDLSSHYWHSHGKEIKPTQMLPPDFYFFASLPCQKFHVDYEDRTYGIPNTSNLNALSVSSLCFRRAHVDIILGNTAYCLPEKLLFTDRSLLCKVYS